MQRNIVFAAAAVLVVALVGFAIYRTSSRPDTPAASAPAMPAASAPDVPFIEQAEAKQLADRSGVTMLDVRDADSYLVAHIPGALQIPLSRVEGEVPYLPKATTIVAYCTCPHDEAAIEAVQILRHAGVQNARVLRGGLQEWTRLGYPVASGNKS